MHRRSAVRADAYAGQGARAARGDHRHRVRGGLGGGDSGADRAPRGADAIHDVLEGAIIWITWPTIIKKGAAYGALGLLHFLLRKRFIAISFHPEEAERQGWSIRFWTSCSICRSASP